MQRETKKTEKKRVAFLFLSTLFVLFLISLTIGGFFFFRDFSKQKQKEKITKEEGAEETIKPLSPYLLLRETPQGKIIENTKEGISLKVPEGWIFQVPTSEEDSFSFFGPDVIQGKEGEEYRCKITFSILGEKTNIDQLQNKINSIVSELFTVEAHKFEIIEVSGYKALKSTLKTAETGYSITVKIPLKDRVYDYIIYSAVDHEKKCSREFDKFLETISLKE